MQFKSYVSRCLGVAICFVFLFFPPVLRAQSNINLRVMAANLNGNSQTYEPFAIRIFQGLKPDVVAIQEFNYGNNTASDFRAMVDTAFGTNFVYFRENYSGIPNGVISRYPIVASGSWPDPEQSQPNRGFAWAQIHLPGSNDLYVVSVHLLTSGDRTAEAVALKTQMQANFPPNAWIVVAGDFNASSRTEGSITTFNGYLSDFPIPVDNNGNSFTSANRNSPHDFVLPSLTFTNFETATILSSHSFPSGLVFDSNVYMPLSDVVPILSTDSGMAQHMAVMKDFTFPAGTNAVAPTIITQPQSQAISPGSNVTFIVTATGSSPFSYQWLFNGTNISGANTNPFSLANVQFTNAGNYSVIVTNTAGSVTSSNALLTVSNFPPTIITPPPQNQTVYIGDSATFSVTASGTAPLNYQWRFNGTNISGANTNSYTRASVQTNDTGNYTVVVTNISGAITSSPAMLTVLVSNQVSVIAQWNFNSSTADTNVGTGITLPSIGSGTASLAGGITATFATGSAADPASADNSGWNTTGYPGSTNANKSAGVRFNVSTVGRQNIVIQWDQRVSNTGSKYSRLQYTTNGTDFVDFPTSVVVASPANFEPRTNNLSSISGVNNNSNFAFRIVSEFEFTAVNTGTNAYVNAGGTGPYAGTGTVRFDMVTVLGTAIATNAPPIPATLSAFAYTGAGFQFQLTGSAGLNYVIQTSTNLSVNNWTSLFTNTSPFTFVDTNTSAASQNFYRAISLP